VLLLHPHKVSRNFDNAASCGWSGFSNFLKNNLYETVLRQIVPEMVGGRIDNVHKEFIPMKALPVL